MSARTSPKAQRPPQSSRTVRASNSHNQSGSLHSDPLLHTPALNHWRFVIKLFLLRVFAATRSPKSGPSQDTPYLDTSSVSLPAQKTSGPAPLFPVDGTVSPSCFCFVVKNQSQNFFQVTQSNGSTWLISLLLVSSLQWMRSLVQLLKNAQPRAPAAQRKARLIKVCLQG